MNGGDYGSPTHQGIAKLQAMYRTEQALADDLAAEVEELREAILNLCNDNGLEAPEVALTDGVSARYREARQQR
jgi:hypothetical protein